MFDYGKLFLMVTEENPWLAEQIGNYQLKSPHPNIHYVQNHQDSSQEPSVSA